MILGNVTGANAINSMQLESKNRQITYSDIQMITNNFEKLLGQGGFGKVYLGFVEGNPVAVKMISQSAICISNFCLRHIKAICAIFFSSFKYMKIICDFIL